MTCNDNCSDRKGRIMAHDALLQIRLTNDQLSMLRKASEQDGVPVSEIVRRAIDVHFRARRMNAGHVPSELEWRVERLEKTQQLLLRKLGIEISEEKGAEPNPKNKDRK